MKISAQEEYGLRCLVQLAQAKDGRVVTVREIAAKEGLTPAYVEKLLRLLAKAKLVHSLRGIKGGYVLSKPAREITLDTVVRSLGQVLTTEHICQQFTGLRTSCIHFSNCGIRSVWSDLTVYIQHYLTTTTLDSLIGDERAVSNRLAKQMGGVS